MGYEVKGGVDYSTLMVAYSSGKEVAKAISAVT
jgi:hypothetical protein